MFVLQQEQFGLYALYSKNKPKSDALLASHGHAFFRVRTVTSDPCRSAQTPPTLTFSSSEEAAGARG